MAGTNLVNLDALLPREDFSAGEDAPPGGISSSINRVPIRDLETGFLIPLLKKPDFQRETAAWTPEKVLDLVTAFLDGDLIPAIILWESGRSVFVIDGAHRISALMAWVHNDYGDGTKSKQTFANHIAEEQNKVADRTRRMINAEVGSYADYLQALSTGAAPNEKIRARLDTMGKNALIIQWVPARDVATAEKSFFKINEAATPIDPTERRILKSRYSPNAIAARAIARRAAGHKYWKGFPAAAQTQIEDMGVKIYDALYEPPLETPIKTLDLPVAGRGYSTIPFVFDLVNLANNVRVPDSTRRRDVEDTLPKDEDGTKTVDFLKVVRKVVDRVTGPQPASVGPHPAVYFYSRGGSFQPAAFLATATLLSKLSDGGKLLDFRSVRNRFEEFLVTHKEFMTQIVHKRGSGSRSFTPLVELYEHILRVLWAGGDDAKILSSLEQSESFKFLVPTYDPPEDASSEDRKGKPFSRKTKSAAFLRDALAAAVRCSICGARLHKKSIEIHHAEKRSEGGSGTIQNAQLAHPNCNSLG